jgi:hypothetical protein
MIELKRKGSNGIYEIFTYCLLFRMSQNIFIVEQQNLQKKISETQIIFFFIFNFVHNDHHHHHHEIFLKTFWFDSSFIFLCFFYEFYFTSSNVIIFFFFWKLMISGLFMPLLNTMRCGDDVREGKESFCINFLFIIRSNI